VGDLEPDAADHAGRVLGQPGPQRRDRLGPPQVGDLLRAGDAGQILEPVAEPVAAGDQPRLREDRDRRREAAGDLAGQQRAGVVASETTETPQRRLAENRRITRRNSASSEPLQDTPTRTVPRRSPPQPASAPSAGRLSAARNSRRFTGRRSRPRPRAGRPAAAPPGPGRR